MRLIEIRDYDGPNLYARVPVIKLELELMPGDSVSIEQRQCVARILDHAIDDDPITALKQVITTLHQRAELPPPPITHRWLDQTNHIAFSYPWEWRSVAILVAERAYALLSGERESDPVADLYAALVIDRENDDRPDWVRDRDRRIPVISVTGTNGKTTTTRILAHISRQAGWRTGWSSSAGVYIDGEEVLSGDFSGPSGARRVLAEPDVELGIFETARGGILLRGMGCESNDVGVLLNVSSDHLGIHGIERIETLAEVKSVVVQTTRPDGVAVLNADDLLVVAQRTRIRARITYVSRSPDNQTIRDHVAHGGKAVVRNGSVITLIDGDSHIPVINLRNVPSTYDGNADHMVENVLAATAAALGLGFDLDTISHGLSTFQSNSHDNSGRLNVFYLDGYTVVVDYAHNERGLSVLLSFAHQMVKPDGRILAVIGTAGDRQDNVLTGLGQIAGREADRIFIKENPRHLRGGSREHHIEMMRNGVRESGAENRIVGVYPGEHQALIHALCDAQAGDCIAIMCVEEQTQVLDELRSRNATESI